MEEEKPKIKRPGAGRKPIPITRKDIERAQTHTKSNKGAARYMGISFDVYRTAAKKYFKEDGVTTLYDAHKNRSGKGIPKLTSRKNGEHLLMDILEGRVTSQFFSLTRIKERLIEEGYMEYCCNRCGYKETRALDEKIPLILSFKNNNKKDWRLENIEFLCYNCYFINIGDVFSKDQLAALEVYHLGGHKKKITQMDLPPQHAEAIVKLTNLDNKQTMYQDVTPDQEKPLDYGDDLISFVHMKRK